MSAEEQQHQYMSSEEIHMQRRQQLQQQEESERQRDLEVRQQIQREKEEQQQQQEKYERDIELDNVQRRERTKIMIKEHDETTLKREQETAMHRQQQEKNQLPQQSTTPVAPIAATSPPPAAPIAATSPSPAAPIAATPPSPAAPIAATLPPPAAPIAATSPTHAAPITATESDSKRGGRARNPQSIPAKFRESSAKAVANRSVTEHDTVRNNDVCDENAASYLVHCGYRVSAKFEERQKDAREEEAKQLLRTKTFVPIHPNILTDEQRKAVLPCQILVTDKYTDGGPGKERVYVKTKARIVAGGHKQPCPEHGDASAPTVRQESLLTTLAIAAKEEMNLASFDIVGAYLFSDLKNKNLFMKLPRSIANTFIAVEPSYSKYVQRDGSIYVHLVKALYGLKESGKLWHEHISATMITAGFKRSAYDQCIFFKHDNDGKLKAIASIHVDDILTGSNCEETDKVLSQKLQETYGDHKRQEGTSIQYLGMHIQNDKAQKVINVTQSSYTQDVLTKHNIKSGATTPAGAHLHTTNESSELIDPARYKATVMQLMYLATKTRPDILLPLSHLATHSQTPTKDDENKLYRVLRYLHDTKGKGLAIRASDLQVQAWADASYNVHPDGKGHTGFIIGMGNGVNTELRAIIMAKSKKQTRVTKSSTEAELLALNAAADMAIWARNLVEEMGYKQHSPTIIYQDNKSTIHIAEHVTGKSGKLRHLHHSHYWIRERIQDGEIQVKYMNTHDMIPDILTKPLFGAQFKKFTKMLIQ